MRRRLDGSKVTVECSDRYNEGKIKVRVEVTHYAELIIGMHMPSDTMSDIAEELAMALTDHLSTTQANIQIALSKETK